MTRRVRNISSTPVAIYDEDGVHGLQVSVAGSNGVLSEQGLAANRPAATALPAGSIYFSVDTGALEYTDGTTWAPVP